MRRIQQFGARLAATVAAAVALSACSGSGTGNENLTDDEEGFREASKVLATLIGEQDAEGFCSFLDAENEGTFLRAVGVQDCVAAAESRLSDITEDERASWVSADFSTTETRVQSPGRDGSVWIRAGSVGHAERRSRSPRARGPASGELGTSRVCGTTVRSGSSCPIPGS